MTYENEDIVCKMVESQGYVRSENGILTLPEGVMPKMMIPSELVPYCPRCHKPMSMNLRADASFVQDEGWDIHAGYYEKFLDTHKKGKILFLELGVGYNTPGIIKYPFWQMTARNKNAEYVCINKGEVSVPMEIKSRSIEIDSDIYSVIKELVNG